MIKRKWGDKAIEARLLAEASVKAERAGNVKDANVAYEALCRLVTRGNAAYHMLTAVERVVIDGRDSWVREDPLR